MANYNFDEEDVTDIAMAGEVKGLADEATTYAQNLVFGADPSRMAAIQGQMGDIKSQREKLLEDATPRPTEKNFLNMFLESLLPVAAAGIMGGGEGLAAIATPFANQQQQAAKERAANKELQREFAGQRLKSLSDREEKLQAQMEKEMEIPTTKWGLMTRLAQKGVISQDALLGSLMKDGSTNININNQPAQSALPMDVNAIADSLEARGIPVDRAKLANATVEQVNTMLDMAGKIKVTDKATGDLAASAKTSEQVNRMVGIYDAISKPKEGQTTTEETFSNLGTYLQGKAPEEIPGKALTGEKAGALNKADAVRYFNKNRNAAALNMASDALAGIVTEPDKQAFLDLFPKASTSRDIGMPLLRDLERAQRLGFKVRAAIAGQSNAVTLEELQEWSGIVQRQLPGSSRPAEVMNQLAPKLMGETNSIAPARGNLNKALQLLGD